MARMPSARNAAEPQSHFPRTAPAFAGLSLQITIGRSRGRTVTLAKSRNLIGSSDACDLQLSEALPPLHSLIVLQDGAVWFEPVVSDPPTLLNGRPCDGMPLTDGDCIEFGPVRMIVRSGATGQLPVPDMKTPEPLTAKADDVRDLAELSATELVERLEREQALVDEFDSRRQTGLEAMLDAAFRRAGEPEPAPSKPGAIRLRVVGGGDLGEAPHGDNFPVPRIAREDAASNSSQMLELDTIVDMLNRFADELDQRACRLADRERQQAEATATLLDMQQRLAEQLDSALARIAALEASKPLPTRNVA